MKEFSKKIESALDSCKLRGHKMGGLQLDSTKKVYHYMCEKCGKSVFIDKKPAPNSIDISGEAVALDCEV